MGRRSRDQYPLREELELFLERVKKLKANSLVADKKLLAMSFESSYTTGKEPKFELRDADDELLDMERFDALMGIFRLFYMDGEPTHWYHICNELYQIAPADRQEQLSKLRNSYSRTLREQTPFVGDDGQFETYETLFKNWINGELAHSDKEKRQFVKKWGESLKAHVAFQLGALYQYIIILGNHAQLALDENWLD